MQARYYDPMIGRFLSNDPMGFADMGGDPAYMNRYAYVANDPVNAWDPTGLCGTRIEGHEAANCTVTFDASSSFIDNSTPRLQLNPQEGGTQNPSTNSTPNRREVFEFASQVSAVLGENMLVSLDPARYQHSRNLHNPDHWPRSDGRDVFFNDVFINQSTAADNLRYALSSPATVAYRPAGDSKYILDATYPVPVGILGKPVNVFGVDVPAYTHVLRWVLRPVAGGYEVRTSHPIPATKVGQGR